MEISSKYETAARGLSVLGLAVLCFIGGAYTAEFEVFPYPQLLDRPFRALEAYRERQRLISRDPGAATQWQRISKPQTGVVLHDRERAGDGYVLFTSAHETAAYLMDNEGRIVHEWAADFREAFPDGGRVFDPVPEYKIHWPDAHLFPNGDLIANYAGVDTPYGYGLVKIDRDSEVVWRYSGRVHHDFDVEEDGTVWALTHAFRDTDASPVRGTARETGRVLEDFAVEIAPDGEQRRKISLVEVVAGHDRDVIDQWFRDEKGWDWLHVNDIDVVGPDFAEHHSFADPGHLLFSSRSLNAVGLVDPDARELDWISRGPWKKQHDPDALANGNILMFDNQGGPKKHGRSRILEIEPESRRIVWQYDGSSERPFDCTWWGKQTPLSNGNVLVADSLSGRIFEVTRDRTVVWDWRTPAAVQDDGRWYIPNIKAPVVRVRPGELEFEPQGPPESGSRLRAEFEEYFGPR